MQSSTLTGSVKGQRLVALIIDLLILRSLTAGILMLSLLEPISSGAIEGSTLTDQRMELFLSPLQIVNILQSAEQNAVALIAALILFVLAFVYFSFVPYKMNGQTIGKKITKIKAVNKDYENPSLLQHILRAVYNYTVYLMTLALPIVALVYLFTFSPWALAFALGITVSVASIIGNIAFSISMIMVLFRGDALGVHDMVAGTMVVPETDPFE